MDRLTRKELKTDKFAVEVGHTVEFLEEHRKQAIMASAAVVVVILAVVGFYYYSRSRHIERQEALRDGMRTFDATIAQETSPFVVSFKTQEEKDTAIGNVFNDIVKRFAGSDEAAMAKFYLGISASNQGKPEEAEKLLKEAIDDDRQPFSSQAALSLAQLYAGQQRNDEAETLLEGLMEDPTVLVSREQATIELAKLVALRDQEEARKLLEPLRTARSAVSRAALTVLGGLQPAE